MAFLPQNDIESLVPIEPVTDPLDFSVIQQLENNQAMIRSIIDEIDSTQNKNNSKPKRPKVALQGKNEGPFKCELCPREYVHATGLQRHMIKHKSKEDIKSFVFKINPVQETINCLICGLVFASIDQALDHLSGEHQSEDEEDVKEEEEEDQNKKTIILDAVLAEVVYGCEFCEWKFWDVAKLFAHEKNHNPNIGFQCITCKTDHSKLTDAQAHWDQKCDQQICVQSMFLCNECGSAFPTRQLLYGHRYSARHFFPRRSDGQLKVACEECNEIFSTAKELLVHHQKFHSISVGQNVLDRRYLCEICGKSYTQSSHLWQHLRFHKGIKPFGCSVPGCSRTFTIRPDLNDHIRKCHTLERPYACKICGKRFLTGSVYYQHRLIHLGERRYGCEECGKRFYRADALKNHSRIHSGEKPYPCQYCAKRFRQKGDKDKHTKARHSYLLAVNENARINGGSNCAGPSPPVVMIGNVSFPKSMFKPLMTDIDAGQQI